MNTADGFLESIVAQIDDDAPRLVYADWLEEHGDADRADFIRVQVERARLPAWDGRQVTLRLREQELLRHYGARWKAELPPIEGVQWGEFRRGFVGEATFPNYITLGASLSACRAAAPVEAANLPWPMQGEPPAGLGPVPGLREVTVHSHAFGHDGVRRFAASPLLSTLNTLNIPNCGLSGAEFRRLLASPHLGGLTTLRAPLNAIGSGAISALFAATSLTSLAELDLAESGSYGRSRSRGRYHEDSVIEATDLRALAGWPGLARLRSLTLSGNHPCRDGLRALLRSPHVAGLKSLTFRNASLAGQEMQEFGAANPNMKLESLDLGDNVLGDLGPADLALAPCLSELKVLNLDRCEIRLSGARWLVNAPFIGSLRRLNVNDNSFGAEGVYRLLEKKPRHLHTLLLMDNDLGDEGAAHLAESPAGNVLLELDLSHNGLGDPTAKSLRTTKQLRALQVLRLTDHQFSAGAVAALANSPLGKRLAVLEFTREQ